MALEWELLPQNIRQKIELVLHKNPEFQTTQLFFENGKLLYRDAELGNLCMDILSDTVNYQRKSHRGKQELIAKAMGLGKGNRLIHDATFGLGQDAIFLASLGAKVSATERQPIIWLLMADALERAQLPIELIWADSLEWMSQDFENRQRPEVVYLDPMFPHKKKSALPRKEMQIFRKLAGDDLDADQLFTRAIQFARDRVVVKRPLKAPDLASGKVHSFEGTTVRYDVYKAMM